MQAIDHPFAPIPAEYRLTPRPKVPGEMAESETTDYFHARADQNAAGYALFWAPALTTITGRW